MRQKPIVLSVDDDANFRKTIELVLSRFGVNVKGVSTVEEFLAAAKTLKPDLYLIDLQLGEVNGTDLIRAIQHGHAPKAFIIVVSGSKKPEMITHALELGANDYILKPLDRVLLATKLAQYIETEEIKSHRAEWKEPGKEQGSIRIQFEGAISEIDELGVKFTSTTLVPKGTVLKLNSDIFEKIGAKETEYLVTVTSTWLNPESKEYGAYAEFDGVDADFLQLIRHWLTQNLEKKPNAG